MKPTLEGIRVLDFTRVTAGPYGSLLLADLGAEVIKIENPGAEVREGRTQLARLLKEKYGKEYGFEIKGIGTHFLTFNRNKKSVVLNMRSEKGQEIFRELVGKADIVYDNYRAGVTKRMGIDYETLSKINPRIITCSITGFGESGPLSNRPTYDSVVQSMGGGVSLTTGSDGAPVKPAVPIADLGAGMYTVIGMLAAIYAREKTGKGRKVDVSILDGQISLQTYWVTDYFASGEVWGSWGKGRLADATHRYYECKDGGYILSYGPFEDRHFKSMCKVMGREDLLADPRFNTDEGRALTWEPLVAILKEIFLTKTVDEWDRILTEADIPCGPLNTIDKVLNDPQVIHQGMVGTYPHPIEGEFKAAGNPIKVSDHEQVNTAPPLLGQHTVEILSGLLGYSQEKLAELKEEGIIAYP